MRKGDDLWSEMGASRLAQQLREYWLKRGFSVNTWIVKAKGGAQFNNQPRFDVRSDMVGGWPTRRLENRNLLAA